MTMDDTAGTGQRSRRKSRLREFDAVLTRKDPPFNMEHVYTTYLLELAETHVIPSFEAGLSP
jgi:glutathione synthase/RimK-type ligase-like ATP-grasp enzyme